MILLSIFDLGRRTLVYNKKMFDLGYSQFLK